MDNAKYTVLLKTIMTNPETKPLLEKAMSSYPIYVQKKIVEGIPALIPTREELNSKILNFYKYREIGFETVGRFLDELEISLNEIMPYYNQMMSTVEIMNDLPSPFDNVDVIETYEEEKTGNSKSEGSSSSKQTSESENEASSNAEVIIDNDHLSKRSDTPQNDISNLDKYLSEATQETANDKNTSSQSERASGLTTLDGSSESSGTIESSEITKHTYTKKGNQGVNTYAHDMIEFRTSILNIEQMIINDPRISELFMMVY